MSAEDEVRQASARYYSALNHLLNGDAGPMMKVWSHSSHATTMNPYGGREVGWEEIQAVFEEVGQMCLGNFVYLFPDGRFVPRWMWILPLPLFV